MAFITSIIGKHQTNLMMTRTAFKNILHPSLNGSLRNTRSPMKMYASLHPEYDIAVVSTYIAYFFTQYWGGEQRLDVQIFAMLMGTVWNFTHDHDATIFIMLWLIGLVSEFISKSFLAGGNKVEYENFRVGIKLGGYMSFLLLVFDVLDVLTGI